jgi:hypothetical protein
MIRPFPLEINAGEFIAVPPLANSADRLNVPSSPPMVGAGGHGIHGSQSFPQPLRLTWHFLLIAIHSAATLSLSG